jgi:hypothetical protein
MSPYAATKKALKTAAAELGIDINTAETVFRGGQDPGGWSRKGSLVCIIHEGTGIPNDYNHRDPLGWWMKLGDEVSRLSGQAVYFEWINGCVAAGYPA